MARPHLSAAVAGTASASVPLVQLDEALEQEGERGGGKAQGRLAQEWAEPVELELAALVEQVDAEARARNTPVLGARAVRAQHSIPGPSNSSAARGRWGMPPRAGP